MWKAGFYRVWSIAHQSVLITWGWRSSSGSADFFLYRDRLLTWESFLLCFTSAGMALLVGSDPCFLKHHGGNRGWFQKQRADHLTLRYTLETILGLRFFWGLNFLKPLGVHQPSPAHFYPWPFKMAQAFQNLPGICGSPWRSWGSKIGGCERATKSWSNSFKIWSLQSTRILLG